MNERELFTWRERLRIDREQLVRVLAARRKRMTTVPETRDFLLGWLRSYIAQIQAVLGWEEPITVFDHHHYGLVVEAPGIHRVTLPDEFFDLHAREQRLLVVDALLTIMVECDDIDQVVTNLATFIAPHLPTLGGE